MRKVIYVLSHGNDWKVQCLHCDQDKITKLQSQAIAIAKQHVASLSPGSLSQILVQRDDGKFRTEWTYGEDPFPPKG